MLPFTHDAFLAVFAGYNAAIWPAQVAAYGLGLAAVLLTRPPRVWSDRAAAVLLGVQWLWTGVAYHWLFFSRINPAAYVFGALFVAQALLLFHAGARRRLVFGPSAGLPAAAGWALIVYAMAAYPLIGLWAGQAWPGLPMFGVAPCPVTVFTLGMLLLSSARPPWRLLAVPALWSLIGGSAAILLAVPQDWVLLFAGAGALLLLSRKTGTPRGADP